MPPSPDTQPEESPPTDEPQSGNDPTVDKIPEVDGTQGGDDAPANPEAAGADVREGENQSPERAPDAISAVEDEIENQTDTKVKKAAATADQGMREAPQPPSADQKQSSRIDKERADVENMQAIERDRSESTEINEKNQPSINGKGAGSRKKETVGPSPDTNVSMERLREKLSSESQKVLNQLMPNGQGQSLGEVLVKLSEKTNNKKDDYA